MTPADQSGTQFGGYTLLEKIGSGGMADVYKAEKRGVGGFVKTVAIKRILPHLMENEQFVNMFIDEARIAATLNHGNIVSIHDFGQCDGQLFLVMELVEGCTLAQILRKLYEEGRPLPLRHALFIGLEIAKGLQCAHSRMTDGSPAPVVHRDISPQNILVAYSGEVKIVDFGVAKTKERLTVTQAHSLKGKLAYMSPEQVHGGEIDCRSDIFSVGILLHEMLTGRRLFKGKHEAEVLLRVIQEAIPKPSSKRPTLPAEVDAICMKSLERDVAQRYQNIGELGRDISHFLLKTRLDASHLNLSEFLSPLFPTVRAKQEKEKSLSEPAVQQQAFTRLLAAEINEVEASAPQPMHTDPNSAQAHLLVERADDETPATLPGRTENYYISLVKELSNEVSSREDVALWVQTALLARLSLISRRSTDKRSKIVDALIKAATGQLGGEKPPH